jgi:hypothetical protein
MMSRDLCYVVGVTGWDKQGKVEHSEEKCGKRTVAISRF